MLNCGHIKGEVNSNQNKMMMIDVTNNNNNNQKGV